MTLDAECDAAQADDQQQAGAGAVAAVEAGKPLDAGVVERAAQQDRLGDEHRDEGEGEQVVARRQGEVGEHGGSGTCRNLYERLARELCSPHRHNASEPADVGRRADQAASSVASAQFSSTNHSPGVSACSGTNFEQHTISAL